MTTRRLPSNWLDNPSDADYVKKSIGRGLGSFITGGATQIEKLAALAETPVTCTAGHVFKLIDSPERYCSHPVCKGKKVALSVEGEPLVDPDVNEETGTTNDRTRPVGVNDAPNPDEVETGGTLDGRPLKTSKSRIRRPWTGVR